MYLVFKNENYEVNKEAHIYGGRFFNSLDDAKNYVIRKAAGSKGEPEWCIYNHVGTTETGLPTEVTVNVNGN